MGQGGDSYMAMQPMPGRDVREVGGAEVILFSPDDRPVASDAHARREMLRLLSVTLRSFELLDPARGDRSEFVVW